MPTYDYKCDACGHAFEKFQGIKSPVLKRCPACGQNRLKRLIGTGSGVIFKGGGFYQTDYRSDSYKAAAKAEGGGGSGGSGEGGGASKDAEKSPAKSEPAAATAETKSEAKAADAGSATPPKPPRKKSA